jgi:hypothetical protein
MGALDNDPVYLFTEHPMEEHLFRFFEHEMRPFLLYLQEGFAPPCTFDSHRAPPLPQKHPIQGVREYSYPNFKFKILDSSSERDKVWEYMMKQQEMDPGVKYNVTRLTVTIPSSKNDPFWKLQDFDQVSWDPSPNQLTFTIERSARSKAEAQYFATVYAKYIISLIRTQLQASPPLRTPVSLPSPHACIALELGLKLFHLWRSTHHFLNQTAKGWEQLLEKLDGWIVEYPQFMILLKYYKVSVLFCVCVKCG